jgi:hypothetical protein
MNRDATDALAREIAELIAEHVGVGYEYDNDGHIDTDTIRVYALGAAHVVIHRLLELPFDERRTDV